MDLPFVSPAELCDAVGRRAKERRLSMGLRQIDVAVQAGVPLTTLKRFENSGDGSLETVVRIAFVLCAERGFDELFPRHDARTLDDVLAANQTRRRVRK